MHKEHGTFRRAMEISVLLHLLLVFLIAPKLHQAWTIATADVKPAFVQAAENAQRQPLEFELVDLPNQQEEKPPDDRPVPLSDMDRRAHGGEGEAAAQRPGTTGNTYQLVQADGANYLGRGAPPVVPGPQTQQMPPPEPDQTERTFEPEPQPEMPSPEGAGEEQEQTEQRPPTIQLPPPGVALLPPDMGGFMENPDRQGGEVDEGGVSFDTQWYDWGPYAAKMLRKIRRNWRIPEIAMLGVKGVARVRFFIERDGTVTGIKILNESGRPPMDFAARDAISHASPFEPLPGDLAGVEREGVTITFYYNMRAPRRRGGRGN
ncbi:MAG: energy transducer TonB [bacterium]|nr:energy transducer TonB [bacterium]